LPSSNKKENTFFNEFLNELQQDISIKEFYKLINSIFTDKFSFDYLAVYIFGNDNKFRIKHKMDKKLELPNEIDNLKIITSFFIENSLKFYKKKKFDGEIFDLFSKIKKIGSMILAPLIKKKHIYGFIWLAIREDNKYKPNLTIMNIIIQIINCYLSNMLLLEEVIKHNKELQEIAKAMRHDFANDLQSIAMVNELLLTTELNNDQRRFVRLLGNAKDSATEKLAKIKQLKEKFEKEIDYSIGLPLNK